MMKSSQESVASGWSEVITSLFQSLYTEWVSDHRLGPMPWTFLIEIMMYKQSDIKIF